MAENAMTPADMGAVLGNHWGNGFPYMANGFGFGNNDMMGFLFLVLLMTGGGFGGGWGNRGAFGTEAIQNQMQQGFDNQNSMANQREILGATNQVYHDITNYVGDKYAELDRDVLGISSTLQQVMANQNQCCCSTLRAIDGVNYANAQNTAAINANTTAQTQKILDALAQNKIASLESQVADLRLANQMQNVVRYPNGWTYNAGQSPFCGGGCGCGCGF